MKVTSLYTSTALALKRILQGLVFISFALMVVLVFAQVVTRYLTDSSLTWSEELSRFIMVWMVYLASILTYNAQQHIVVDALISQLHGLVRTVLLLLNKVAVMVFVTFVVTGAYQFLPTTAIQKSPANSIVMAHVYVVIPISLFCIGVLTIRDIVVLIQSFFQKKTDSQVGVNV